MLITPAIGFLFIALVLIAIELFIMQFSFFWFFFVGIAAFITALIAWVFPDASWVLATGLFLLISLATIAVLFPLLKRWQAKQAPIAGHDAIGQSVQVITVISASNKGTVLWSGSKWPASKADSEADFQAGDKAVIRKVEGITLIVGR